MSKVALVIIFNHQYNKNIEVLENIYKNKFSNIYHLVPFYDGEKTNVIPVYENSFYFQGYIAQGFKSFFDKQYQHYFFIGDDLLLNPIINEDNYTRYLNLTSVTSFLPGFINLHESDKYWPRVHEAFCYDINNTPGVEAASQLPDKDTTLQLFNRMGLNVKPLNFRQIWGTPFNRKQLTLITKKNKFWILTFLKSKLGINKYELQHPIVGSYSDICVVSADAIKQFCHYCGVTAATKLFVEIALPTSLVLSAKKIVTEKEVALKGRALWSKEDYSVLDKYENNLEKLLLEFPENYLYLHPIKLSKWK